MKIYWTAAALLSASMVIGCGGRNAENEQNLEQTAPAAPTAAPVEPGAQPSTVDAPPGAPSVQRDASATSGSPSAPAARSAAAPPVDTAPRWREVDLPAGTALPLELLTAVSSETAAVETPVRARLRQAVVVDGFTALPAGAVLHGHVIDVARAGRVQGRSRLALRFTEVEIGAGREDLRTNPLAFEGEATRGEDATKVGAGAIGGAIVGGILGGGDGAAKGAAIGGAAGTGVVLAPRGREVTLAAGTDLAATLATPFTTRAPAR